ncbi:28411_t:CDS:2, partial [Gigaspora margarita]
QNWSIIIYGGFATNETQASPDLMVLDIKTWEWSIPNIAQKDAPPSLASHSAAIYENYMIVSFESTPIPTILTPKLIIVVTSVASIILIGSVIAGIFMYKKRQELRHSIATPGSK